MGSRDASRILRAPGRLVVNPVDSFADGTFPFGGIEVGATQLCVLQQADTSFSVEYEATGDIGEVLEGGSRFTFVCVLRGFDDAAVEWLMQDGFEAGDLSQHAVYHAPGSRLAGTSSFTRGVRLVYVPDDPIHVPAVMIFNGIPEWTDNGQIAFQRASEFGVPLTVQCVRDAEGRILSVGRLADLSST